MVWDPPDPTRPGPNKRVGVDLVVSLFAFSFCFREVSIDLKILKIKPIKIELFALMSQKVITKVERKGDFFFFLTRKKGSFKFYNKVLINVRR